MGHGSDVRIHSILSLSSRTLTSNIIGTEKLVIIVPSSSNNELWGYRSIFNTLYLWCTVVIIFTLLRSAFNALLATNPSRSLIDFYFDTFGIMYGYAARVHCWAEGILVMTILTVELFASSRITGMFFNKYSGGTVQQIYNLTDLVRLEGGKYLPLCVPTFYEDTARQMFVGEPFSFLPMSEPDIVHQMYSGNRSCAYVLSEPKANELMRNKLDVGNVAPSLFYIIPNTYLC